MNKKGHQSRRSDPETGWKEPQLQLYGSVHAAVKDTVNDLTSLIGQLEELPKVVEDIAPEAYAKAVLPCIAEIRRKSERLGRVVADAELMRQAGRGRRSEALTLQQIADGLGVARSTVARWKRDGPLTVESDDDSDFTARAVRGAMPEEAGGWE